MLPRLYAPIVAVAAAAAASSSANCDFFATCQARVEAVVRRAASLNGRWLRDLRGGRVRVGGLGRIELGGLLEELVGVRDATELGLDQRAPLVPRLEELAARDLRPGRA